MAIVGQRTGLPSEPKKAKRKELGISFVSEGQLGMVPVHRRAALKFLRSVARDSSYSYVDLWTSVDLSLP